MQQDYSVVIRTLGTAGRKYGMLLDSIGAQTVKPREVLVVLAEGYAPPPYHAAGERIVYTRKGMVNQRQVGFEQAVSPYLLVCDDDVSFEPDFVERLFCKMEATSADGVSFGSHKADVGGVILPESISLRSF